jgi:hypothetical protein
MGQISQLRAAIRVLCDRFVVDPCIIDPPSALRAGQSMNVSVNARLGRVALVATAR